LINQDFPRKQNNFKEVTFPWQLKVNANITADIIFGFIPGALLKDTVTLWYHPYYEVPLFTNRMDEIQPASNAQILFTDAVSNKAVGIRTIDPNNRWQSYFLAFDWMALEVRSDTSVAKYQYPFLDPKYKWIVDIQNIGKIFANIAGTLNVQVQQVVPTDFKLYQNFPNPFNPTTTIDYQIPSTQFVTIAIYDILGKEVNLVLKKEQMAGRYSIQWNAGNAPSGVYFYRLTAGNFSETKRLLLLK